MYLVAYIDSEGKIKREFVGNLNIARFEKKVNGLVISFQELTEWKYIHAIVPVEVQNKILEISRNSDNDICVQDKVYEELIYFAAHKLEKEKKTPTEEELRKLAREVASKYAFDDDYDF
jgi:hypothetical protein